MAEPLAFTVGSSWLRCASNWACAASTLAIAARRSRFCANPVSIRPCSLGSPNTDRQLTWDGGVAAAWFFIGRREVPREAPTDVSFVTRAARVDLYGDAANEELFVKPGYGLVHGVMAFDGTIVDGGTVGTGSALAQLSARGRMVQNGFVRSYALTLLAGAALVLLALLVVNW